MVVEIGREPLQEARHAKQRHRASEDEEAALEVLAEKAAAQGARLKVAVRQIGELGEEAAKVPARNEQEQRERHSQHDQQIGSAHVWNPVTKAHIVCRIL